MWTWTQVRALQANTPTKVLRLYLHGMDLNPNTLQLCRDHCFYAYSVVHQKSEQSMLRLYRAVGTGAMLGDVPLLGPQLMARSQRMQS